MSEGIDKRFVLDGDPVHCGELLDRPACGRSSRKPKKPAHRLRSERWWPRMRRVHKAHQRFNAPSLRDQRARRGQHPEGVAVTNGFGLRACSSARRRSRRTHRAVRNAARRSERNRGACSQQNRRVLTRGKDGAAKGAAIGGGAGTGVVLATKGKEMRLAPGADVTSQLTAPLTVRVRVS